MKVKIIKSSCIDSLQGLVNDFLSTINSDNFVDIKYSTHPYNSYSWYTVLIIYKEV